MTTPAQDIINRAFRQMVQERFGDDRIPFYENWDDGEAERWLQRISTGEVALDIELNNNGTAHPVLR